MPNELPERKVWLDKRGRRIWARWWSATSAVIAEVPDLLRGVFPSISEAQRELDKRAQRYRWTLWGYYINRHLVSAAELEAEDAKK